MSYTIPQKVRLSLAAEIEKLLKDKGYVVEDASWGIRVRQKAVKGDVRVVFMQSSPDGWNKEWHLRHQRWDAGNKPNENGLYPSYTGVTVHVIQAGDGSYYMGISECSVLDNFNKKIGRTIARGRARKALGQVLYNIEHQLPDTCGLEPYTLITDRGNAYLGNTLLNT